MPSAVVILPTSLHAIIPILWSYLSLAFNDSTLSNAKLIDREIRVDDTT